MKKISPKKYNKVFGFGLIDTLFAFLLLSPLFFLYSTSQLSQKTSLMTSSEINQAVALAENIRLALIAHGRNLLQTEPSISDQVFNQKLRLFAVDLTRQYQTLNNAKSCNQNEPMMSWTGSTCAVTRFTVNLETLAYSTAEKGQPINILVSWEDQTGNQAHNVKALIGKY
jgi:hypothetical protein